MSQYYSALKFLRFSDRLQALNGGKPVAPVHIRVKPMNLCNHHCWYCAYRTDDVTLGEEMDERDQIPKQKMIELAHEFVEMGVKAVTFSGGGEPLLYKPLPEVIEILAEGGIRIAALTNGSNLKGRIADAFAEHGAWIRVSIDAWDDASYVKSRGAKEKEFTKLVENMAAFTQRDTQCVMGVSFIVGRDNHQHIYDVCRLFKEIGVDHVKVSGAVVSNDAKENNKFHRTIKQEVSNQVKRAKVLVDNKFDVLDHYHDLEDRFEKQYTTCPFLQFLTVIGADQYVYTCQDKAYTEPGKMGSIADRTFKEFWFSRENQDFLQAFDPSQNCNHHCVSHAKNLAIHEFLALDEDHSNFV